MRSVNEYDVVVVGAGQAGLSAAYALAKAGPDRDRYVVLDANPGPGGAWRHRWPSLTLDAAHRVHPLPGMDLPESDSTEPASAVVGRYFGEYERVFELPVLRPVRVTAVTGRDVSGPLSLHTSAARLTTRTLINATGTWDRPYWPYYPGRETFSGRQLHTHDYRSAEDFRGQHERRSIASATPVEACQPRMGERVETPKGRNSMDAREILIDAAQRPIESTRQVLKGIDADVVNRMPDDTHSSIAWLIWHSGRQMDAQLARLSGGTQVWQQDGWVDRFGLDRPAGDSGFGDGPAEIAKVGVSDPALLSGYLEATVGALCTYIRGLSDADLDDIIGHMPGPISRGVRIVSMIDDAVAHVSQAAYLRGLLESWRIGY